MSANIAIYGSLSMNQADTPTRAWERVEKETDIEKVENPYVGMIIYISEDDKYVSVKSLKAEKTPFGIKENALVDVYEPLISSNTSSEKTSIPGPEWEQRWIPVVGTIEEVSTIGGMVSLKEDVELSKTLIVQNDAIINLNNKSIINIASDLNNKCAISISKSLIIKGTGTINGGSGSIYSKSILDINNSYCEIQSGDFVISSTVNDSRIYCFKITNGYLKISGGTFEANNGQIIDSSNSVIEITGGVFKNFNPEMYVAKGYKSVLDPSTNNYKVEKV